MNDMNPTTNNDAAWESLCERCGLCCFEKIEDERGTIFFTRTPCRYLDVVTRECRVYERRFDINPECVKLTPELVVQLRWLHDGCAYRKALHSDGKPIKTEKTRINRIDRIHRIKSK